MADNRKKTIPLTRTSADELLYRSLRAIYHFEKSLEDRFGLDYQGIYLLQLLRRRESASIGEIASALGIRVFTSTRLVQRLENLGYLSKERSGTDRRIVSTHLEPPGEAVVDRIEAFSYEFIVGNASQLPKREQAAFIR
ncbi:MAG: MarR family transcriptional regulator, partial [Spirochaetales bacterium]|nr:MarR family transcriptional regulator [Spirochaetales bacterium]